MLRARDLGIPIIVTGLSRGQMFETRLTGGDVPRRPLQPRLTSTRRCWRRARPITGSADEVSRSLDVRAFEDDRIFERGAVRRFLPLLRRRDDEMLRVSRAQGAVGAAGGHRTLDQLPDQRPRHLRPQEGARISQLRAALQLGRAPRPQDAPRGARTSCTTTSIPPACAACSWPRFGYDEERIGAGGEQTSLVGFYVGVRRRHERGSSVSSSPSGCRRS